MSKTEKIIMALAFLSMVALIILYATDANGTTYYVRETGSTPTSPYTSWETAAAIPDSAVAAGNQDRGGDGNHKIFIAPGTYNGTLTLTDADWAGGTVTGLASTDTTTTAAKGQVMIYAGNATGISIGRSNITISNITLTNGAGDFDCLYVYNTSTGNTANNLYLYNAARFLVNVTGASSITINRSKLAGAKGGAGGTSAAVMVQSTAVALTMNSCIVSASDSFTCGAASNGAGIVRNQSTSGVATFNNCMLFGSPYYAVNNVSTGRVALFNCVIGNSHYAAADGYLITNGSTGTVGVYNSFLMGNPFSQNTTPSNRIFNSAVTIGDTNNIKSGNPYFIQGRRKGFIVPCVDDLSSSGLPYAESVAALFKTLGVTGTYYADMYAWNNAGYAGRAKAINDAFWTGNGGMEVAFHTRSHANLQLPDNAPMIKYGGIVTDGATITINRTADRILIGTDTLTIGTTKTFKDKEWSAIRAAITANAHVTSMSADSTQYAPSGTKVTMLGEVIKAASAQASGFQPRFYVPADSTTRLTEGLLYSEIIDAKSTFEARYGRPVYSFATTYGANNDSIRAAAMAAGLTGLRKALSPTGGTVGKFRLSNIDLMDMSYLAWGYWVDPAGGGGTAAGDTTVTKQLMHWLCEFVSNTGAIVYILAHDQGYDYPEATLAQWAAAIGVIKEYSNITCCSQYEAVNYIKTSGEWATTDNRNYTRTWDDSSDYHLKSVLGGYDRQSPMINMGLSSSAPLRDYDNRIITGTIPAGVYTEPRKAYGMKVITLTRGQ